MALPPEDPPAGVPDWVLTFGDMMSLLLCFFVLLASLSEMKQDAKSRAVIESILEQFGDASKVAAFQESIAMAPHTTRLGSAIDASKEKISKSKKRAKSAGEGSRGQKAKVQTIRDGQRQVIGGPVLFAPGTANLLPEAKQAMDGIGEALRGKRHLIEVRGYEPIGGLPAGSTFTDPYDLAYARARAVADYLAQKCSIRRQILRISVAAPMESAAIGRLDENGELREYVTVEVAESTAHDYGDVPTARR